MAGKPRLTAKQKKQIKQALCDLLEKSPIIEIACQKVGISRMTLCRWRRDDSKFNTQIEESLSISRSSINDLAESKMISLIQEGHASMIRFWLAHNCDRYKRIPDKNLQMHFHAHKDDPDHFAAMMHALPEEIKTFYPKNNEKK